MTTNKKDFLKSEYDAWTFWNEFAYSEYLSEMAQDATKCKCGVYYWKGCKKKCNCK